MPIHGLFGRFRGPLIDDLIEVRDRGALVRIECSSIDLLRDAHTSMTHQLLHDLSVRTAPYQVRFEGVWQRMQINAFLVDAG